MARIAQDLGLLLLDNASAQPALDRTRHGRVLSAAVLLDLAYACRIRPAVDNEPVEAGRLVALIGPEPTDPVVAPALQMLRRRPMSPAASRSSASATRPLPRWLAGEASSLLVATLKCSPRPEETHDSFSRSA